MTGRTKQSTVRPAASGATPAGTTDQRSAGAAVRKMFDSVAPRYDLLNHLLSANIDRLWWNRGAKSFDHILGRPGAQVLDLCCGTGDMSLALLRRTRGGSARIRGVDFSHEMLRRGVEKFRGTGIAAIEADALQLPFGDGAFDLVTSAFGFRNLVDYRAGLREIRRVLRGGGEFGILDFSQPGGVLGKIYAFYFRRVLPAVGGLISGDREAYVYLPASVEKFPSPPEMLQQMRDAGFVDVEWRPYTFGIAGLYRGKKP